MPLADIIRSFGESKLDSTVRQLVADARFEDAERREHGRTPFFHPVIIEIIGEGRARYSAFTRDVSETGLGLLHWMPIEPQPIVVTTRLLNDQLVSLNLEVSWCIACGEGWYISGGEFTGVVPRVR